MPTRFPSPTASSSHASAIVLVRPQEDGNIGATARAMANLGLERLILVAPRAPIGVMARAFAVHAGFVLDQAIIADDLASALAPFRRVVGTTSARDRHLGIPLVDPREAARRLVADPQVATALVFGPENSGLTNDELHRCELLINIPASPVQPTLNLAQSVLIVAYELFLANLSSWASPEGASPPIARALPDAPPVAPYQQVEGLFAQWVELLAECGFARDSSFASATSDLRALLARARPSEQDVRILRGVARRIRGRLRAKAQGRPPAR